MYDSLKKYCKTITDFTEKELSLIDKYFFDKNIAKKEFHLKIGQICKEIAFINSGSIRHFHIKDGTEITCDISFENTFITEFNSFNFATKSAISFQALTNTQLYVIEKTYLMELYQICPKFEEFGRKIAEKVALRNTNIAMSLSSDKPEERYNKLLQSNPQIFQKVQQKYIANFLGITPESLSRIRKRALQKNLN